MVGHSNGQTITKKRVYFQIAIALFTANGLIAMTLKHLDFENWVQILPEKLPLTFFFARIGFCAVYVW